MSQRILVTGASGKVGSHVIRRLLAQRIPVAASARDRAKAVAHLPAGTEIRIADYGDVSALRRAFQQVDCVLVIPSDGFATSVLLHLRNMIEAAQWSGVGRIVLLSIVDVSPDSRFYYAPVYREAESWVIESGISWTIVRSGLYADLVWDTWLGPSAPSGVVLLPAGDARIAPISREELATAVAQALLEELAGRTLNITGSEALAFTDVARIFGDARGVPLRYEPIHASEYLLRLWQDYEAPWPDAFSSLLASIRQGRYGHVTEDFKFLVGRSPRSFSSCVERWLSGSAPA